MSFRNTIILLAVFILLGGYIYFFETRKTGEVEPLPESPRVTSIETDDINRLEVRHQDKVVSVYKDEQSAWFFDDAQKSPVDRPQLNGVLLLLSGPRAKRIVAQGDDTLPAFGLDKPQLEVTIGLTGNRTERVLLGHRSPDEQYQYVKTGSSEAVYLLDRGVGDVLEKFVAQPPVATPTPTPEPTKTPTP